MNMPDSEYWWRAAKWIKVVSWFLGIFSVLFFAAGVFWLMEAVTFDGYLLYLASVGALLEALSTALLLVLYFIPKYHEVYSKFIAAALSEERIEESRRAMCIKAREEK